MIPELQAILKESAERVQVVIWETNHLMHIHLRLLCEAGHPVSKALWDEKRVMEYIKAATHTDQKDRKAPPITTHLLEAGLARYKEIQGENVG